MKNLFLVMMVLFAAACTPEKKTLAEASLPPTEDDPLQTVDSPLYVQLGTQWEMDPTGPYELNASCEIPRLAPVGTIKTCTFTVPEAQLYYSNLKFFIGTTMSNVCSIIHFNPYYYRRSDQANFRPPHEEDDIDCSATNPDDNKCYGGAAPTMLDDFPENKARYFNTHLSPQNSFLLPSENSTRWYNGESVNYLATNNITDSSTVVAGNVNDARTGEWTDYSVSCTDIWNEPQFQINIIVEDENWDPAGAGADHFTDWP